MKESTRAHYSYSVYADPATARSFDERRFGGPIGDLLAKAQARVLATFAGPVEGRTILDVGTGTGRAALLLAAEGAHVTGVDASDEMLGVARRRASEQHATVSFLVGDAHALDFADRSFEIVVCLRVVMHSPRWRQCVAELCRVADRRVVLDYPASGSFARIQSLARRAARRFGSGTEAYGVFSDREIEEALSRSGFTVTARHRQFVLPIAFHKAIGSSAFTAKVEHLLERAGLLGRFGSPVTIVAERCGSS